MTEFAEGRKIPDIAGKILKNDKVENYDLAAATAGRLAVIFALPGAYTPTCSSQHVPRFNELAPDLKKAGVDKIICLSVNDPFVMQAWGKAQKADAIEFVADADGSFTRAMGMERDLSANGLGMRTHRYAMLVRDGVIEKMFAEPHVAEGDPFTVSDADTVLRYLDPNADALKPVSMLARRDCPWCRKAKDLLDARGISYEAIYLDDFVTMKSVLAMSGQATVPQVFIGGKHIGGFDALQDYFAKSAAA